MIGAFFSEAYGVLAGNKLRTFLTILGLIIGVAAVIAIQILGSGMSGAVSGVLGSLNDRSFYLFPSQRQGDFTKAALTYKDLEQTKVLFPNIVSAIPAGYVALIIASGHEHPRLGVSADSNIRFATIPLLYGRALSAEEIGTSAHVCTLTYKAWQRLFPGGENPVGQSIRIGDHRYVIVGVEDKPTQGLIPVTLAGDIAIPYTTYEAEFLHARTIFAARFLVADASKMNDTEVGVIKYFKDRKAGRSDYQTFDRKSFSSSVDSIFAVLTIVVALIGAVSLVVAGIGIMNIMLVSVTERTREIGVRKAIGATRFQVLAQFFIEALLLSIVGCGIGLCLGLLAGWAIDNLALVKISGVVAPIPWLQSVAIAVGFATIVTLIFGTYPAYRAARLDPIEALRYE